MADLDEVVAERDGLVDILRTLSAGLSHGEQHWWLVIDDTQPLTDAQAALFDRLVERTAEVTDG